MNCQTFCTSLLREARNDLNKYPGFKQLLKGMYVDRTSASWGDGRHFWVKRSNGVTIWEGASCCVWHARYEAILKIIEVGEK